MGIFTTIFGAPAVIEKGLELIDDAFESDEERRESKTNAKIKLMNAYAPFKIAQRYIALIFTVTYVVSYVLVLGMTLADKGNPQDITNVMSQFNINYVMGAIVMFYFGGGMAESMGVGWKTAKDKKDN